MPSFPSPPSPQRIRATLDERPSSSSGPGPSCIPSTENDYDKRRSRDDLLVGLMTAEKREQKQQQHHLHLLDRHQQHLHQQQRFKSFHVPIRGGLQQAQVPSPPEPGFAQRSFSSRGSTTSITNSQGFGDTGVIAIGMALGSPSHPPPGAGWVPGPDNTVNETTPTPAQPRATAGPEEDSAPKRSRKWGLFRSKSRSKKKDNETPHSTLVKSPVTPRPNGKSVLRSDTVQVPSSRQMPQVVRSQTAPLMANTGRNQAPSLSQPPRQTSRPPYKQAQTTPAPAPYAEPVVLPSDSHFPTPKGPMLNVEIPDVTLERYSVMFNQVLMNKRRQSRDLLTSSPSASTSASLLARRQATLTKLTTIGDRTKDAELSPLQPPPGRAPSVPPRESPTFHLFPPTPGRSSSAQAQSPRLRSNTSPAGLPSPGLPSDMPKTGVASTVPPAGPAARAQTFPRLAHENHSLDRLPDANGPAHRRPRLASRFTRPMAPITTTTTPAAEPIAVFHSPTSIEESSEARMKATHHPSVNDPAWAMTSPPPSSHESSASKKDSLSSVVSSEQLTVLKPTVIITDKEAEAEKALREAVQASITRQISVSREQRSMLGSIRGSKPRGRQDSLPVGFGPVVTSRKHAKVVPYAPP